MSKVVQVDLELKKAFQELQAKMIETKQKIKMADIQIEQLNHTKAHSKLTQTEILKLKPNNKMYEGIGRMFVFTDKDTINQHVQERYDKADEKIKTLENSKSYLERSLKDSENNLREMIQQRKDKGEL
ncbi:prefoldin subunit, putative [Pediculus humanus corporis]|uniref:Prefoldin subunit, putative n=1 Tax=Pediculus humanus subsp. corporis TaxID=121224 RepID=E0W2Q3_PEDHC|nr:prefoldin subunit, putative [Pediculus humanus corporis]EEB19909.1 prefoldin subunit, putative [Pediculus humanus corporis]